MNTVLIAQSIGQTFQQTAASGPLLLALGACVLAGLVSFASPCVVPLVPGYLGTDLSPSEAVRLSSQSHDRYHSVDLGGTMSPYRWTLNSQVHPDSAPLEVNSGERVRMRMRNMSDMFHPMHLHGHTFALADSGLRKDTVTIRPMRTIEIEFDTDNPGQWALHCHNAYHQEAGMMTTLSYLA